MVRAVKPDRDPIVQAQAQAGWLKQLMRESTGREFPVAPVILFPGWYVEQSDASLRKVQLLPHLASWRTNTSSARPVCPSARPGGANRQVAFALRKVGSAVRGRL